MYTGIYIDFETYKQEGKHIYKIFTPSDDKLKINREINEFIIIEQGRLEILFDQYQEMRSNGILEEFFNDHLIKKRIYNVIDFEEFFLEDLLNSPNIIKNIIDNDFEMIDIIVF